MGRDKICGVYKVTSPSGRVYIGQSIDCIHRLKQYKWHRCKKQAKLYASILKYGWAAHTSEILQTCEESELNKLEMYYADLFNSYDKEVGLNLRECGGSKGRHKQESIEKCRAAKVGKKKSPEHLAKIVATRKKMFEDGLIIPWNKGLKGVQKSTEESRQKQREKMIGLKRPESHKENCRMRFIREKENPLWNTKEAVEERKRKHGRIGVLHHNSKIVLNLQNGIFYDSAKEVSEIYGINYSNLAGRLSGKLKNHTQFIYA